MLSRKLLFNITVQGIIYILLEDFEVNSEDQDHIEELKTMNYSDLPLSKEDEV